MALQHIYWSFYKEHKIMTSENLTQLFWHFEQTTFRTERRHNNIQ